MIEYEQLPRAGEETCLNLFGPKSSITAQPILQLGCDISLLHFCDSHSAFHLPFDQMQASSDFLDGGCLCGTLRYRISKVGEVYDECYCHCRTCQRSTGAPVVAWIGVRRPNFSWTSGTPTRYVSSPNGTRSFCPKCGTQVLFEFTNAPDELDVTVATLDEPNRTPPKVHLWLSSSPQWFKVHDDLPQFQQERIRQKN